VQLVAGGYTHEMSSKEERWAVQRVGSVRMDVKKKKKVAILQSNYLPWKGYFDIIRRVDVFVFYDDVQYTKNDWRNRNKIQTQQGPQWITIPCGQSESRLICEVELNNSRWQKKHWSSIKQNYQKAPFFERYRPFFEYVFCEVEWRNLSELNQFVIKKISRDFLDLTDVVFEDSRKYHLQTQKGDRVLELLQKVEATDYLSGPAAKSYLDERMLATANIELEWMDYAGYPEYPQLFQPFEHGVSVIDLLFNVGDEAINYMKPDAEK
jgi:hypothetical protein